MSAPPSCTRWSDSSHTALPVTRIERASLVVAGRGPVFVLVVVRMRELTRPDLDVVENDAMEAHPGLRKTFQGRRDFAHGMLSGPEREKIHARMPADQCRIGNRKDGRS